MNIIILGKKYRIPDQPNEISFEDFVIINTYISDIKELTYDNKVNIISLLSKCPVEILNKVDDEDIESLYYKIKYLNEDLPLTEIKSFKIGKYTYTIADLSRLTVKEYLDIDFYLKDGSCVYDNLDKVFAVVLRKITLENKTFKNILNNVKTFFIKQKGLKEYSTEIKEIEELKDSNIEPYSELIYRLFTAQESILLLNKILNVRMSLQKKYSMVFEEPDDEEEIEDKSGRLSVSEIWGWYHTLNVLVDNDKQKLDYWYTRPIEELFTNLAYQKQLNLEIKKQ